jgi:4-amino-4-deoxychorismate lyase
MSTTLVNSQFSDAVSVNNRGLAFADGLFETIKIAAGQTEFLSLHLQRLQRGCERLKIACDVALLQRDISQLLSTEEFADGVLKVTVTRAFSGRGYRPDAAAGSDRIVTFSRAEHDYAGQQRSGVSVRVCDTRLAINPMLAGIKHLARLENVLARAEWSDDSIAEGLLLDIDGRVVEGSMSNLFLRCGQQLVTPSLHRCGVEGIIRQLIIERLCPSLGIEVAVSDVDLADVYNADELFVCNSLIGLWPITSIAGDVKAVGETTRKLQQALLAESGR